MSLAEVSSHEISSDNEMSEKDRIALRDAEHLEGVIAIRNFLKSRTSYDVLPVSWRLILLDTSLLVKKALSILLQNNIVSAPLWDSQRSKFMGLLTSSDFITVIQYYHQTVSFGQAMKEIERFQLTELREVEGRIGAAPPEAQSITPMKPLYDACVMMIKSRARRIPLIDIDDDTNREMVVSVLTQYRILKFLSLNCDAVYKLKKPINELGIGTFTKMTTASIQTPVYDVIQALVKRGIASVPVLDDAGRVINVFEAVDVLTLIRAGDYHNLEVTVGEALLRRPEDFGGVHTCRITDNLNHIFQTIRVSRLHRLIVVDNMGKLAGVVTLSDILNYLILEGKIESRVGTL